jgi:RNA polymerase sigma-54 factor
MQISQSLSMRPEMRQLLTPRMIQSMEILQMPLAALEERIEQELGSNPVLEIKEPDIDESPMIRDESPREKVEALVVDGDGSAAADFERLAKIGEYLENEEWSPSNNYSGGGGRFEGEGERDKKMDAMANTAARAGNLADHLMEQWMFVEAPEEVKQAGEVIIGFLTPDGYLRTDFDTLLGQIKGPTKPTLSALQRALPLVQELEPHGVGARDLQECLLIQLDMLEMGDDDERAEGHDFDLERKLVSDHLKDLEMNRYPQMAKKLGRSIDELKAAVKRLGRLHPYPGHQVGGEDAPPITPDAKIWLDEETGEYKIEMAYDPCANLNISQLYRKMVKDKGQDKKTREFLANNVRNAKWLMESIEQRKSTILRVIRQVVDAQREFFEKGPEYLRPLPMIDVADRLGIHVATVSRAVSEKYIDTPRGIYPLRRFFSGGTQSADGEDMSWDAVKEKLKIIIADEDKQNPLNDDEIVEKLQAQGIELARRTVAKYRKILNIPTARQRKEF